MKKVSLDDDTSWEEIAFDSAVTGGLGFLANKVIQVVLPFDLQYYANKQLSQEALNWLETILAGTENGLYSEVMNCIESE